MDSGFCSGFLNQSDYGKWAEILAKMTELN